MRRVALQKVQQASKQEEQAADRYKVSLDECTLTQC